MTHDLIDRIYEAAVVPEAWRSVLAEIAALSATKGAALIAARGADVRWTTSSTAFEDLLVDHFRAYPMADSERTRRLLAKNHAGFVTDYDVFDAEEIAREPVFRDFMVPRGYGSGVATAILAPSGDAVILHCEGSAADGPVRREAVAALDALRPHLARAALLSARLEMRQAQAATAALEVIGLPAAVLGRNGRALAANAALVGLMPDVVQDRPSRIALADAPADRLLAAAIERLGVAGPGGEVRSIPIRARGERPPIVIHLAPVRGAANDVFARAIGILIATPVAPRPSLAPGVVQGLFDLTPGEAKLAALIAAGHQPREAAAKLGVTEETARTVLKRVFAKTGTHRQVDLVALLCDMPGGFAR